MYLIPKDSTSHPLLFFMVDSTDHVSGKTGLTPTVTIRKVGGSFASPSGAVTEIANGWYQVAGNATDSNTAGPLALHATGTAADVTDTIYGVVDKTVAMFGANVVQEGGTANFLTGTAAAIANGSITLASGQGTTLAGVESLMIILTGGTNAFLKSRYIAHDTGDVFTVDPAWNAGETLPSGTITYIVVPAPPSPTSTIPKVDLDKIAGTTVDTAQAQIGVNVVSLAAAIAAEIRTALGMAAADMDTQLGAIDTVVDAILDDTGSSGVALTAPAVDAILDEVVEGTVTMRQMLRGFAAALLGKASGMATATAVFRDVPDTKPRITATVDADGNRTAVTLDLT